MSSFLITYFSNNSTSTNFFNQGLSGQKNIPIISTALASAGNSTLANQVPTLVVSPRVPAGYRSSVPYTHYSLLRTIEDAWALQPLSANDAAASPLSDFFTPHETTPSPSGRGLG